jgi:hypothetical protein
MSLKLSKIDVMRIRILKNLKELESSKHEIRSHDFTKLMNHHNYILSTLDNMVNIRKIEQSDPWNNMQHANANALGKTKLGKSNKTVIYNTDGSTRVVSNKQLVNTGEGWEHQFDQSMLVNPPCYIMPPQYLTSIKKIRNSGKHDMTRNL